MHYFNIDMSRKLNFLIVSAGIAIIALLNSCTNETIDEEKPTISINYSDGFPSACENLNRGQSYAIKAKVSDNLELASYSIGGLFCQPRSPALSVPFYWPSAGRLAKP